MVWEFGEGVGAGEGSGVRGRVGSRKRFGGIGLGLAVHGTWFDT